MTDPDWIPQFLRIVAAGNGFGEFMWMDLAGDLHFYAICNDTFFADTDDAEEVMSTDLASLNQTRIDVRGQTGEEFWPLLWVCRKREFRPMNLWMIQNLSGPAFEAVRIAFEAAGPPRESVFGAP